MRLNRVFCGILLGLGLLAPTAFSQAGNAGAPASFGRQSQARQAHESSTIVRNNHSEKRPVVPQATSVFFNQGQATLSSRDQVRLRDFIEQASQQGKIKNIHVAVWSDKPFPSRAVGDLPAVDRQLANQRATNIKHFVKDELGVGDVKTFNMAQGSTWLARALNTENAELKSVFAKKDSAQANISNEILLIRDRGQPSAAVVVVNFQPQAD